MDVHDREVAFGCSDHGVYTYDINSGKKRRTLYTKRCGHSEWVTCVTYVGAQDTGCPVPGTTARDSHLLCPPCSLTAWHRIPRFLPDGRLVSGGMDNKLCLWGSSGASCRDLLGHTSSVSCVKSSASGRLIVSGGYDRTVRCWDSSRGSELLSLSGGHSGPVLDIALLPGVVVSGGRDSKVRRTVAPPCR